MYDAVTICLLTIGISNVLLILYLIYLIKFDKEVSKRALTLIKARYSTEQILQDMSIIIAETTEKFEEQTRNVQEQVNRHLQYANLSSAKLNSTLTSICEEVTKVANSYGYNPNFSDIDEIEVITSNQLKNSKYDENNMNSLSYDDNLIGLLNENIENKNISNDDDEIMNIYNMINDGYSVKEIANTLNVKEKKVKVLMNTKKTMSL